MTHKPPKNIATLRRSARLGTYRVLRRWPLLATLYLWNRKWTKRIATWWRRNDTRHRICWRVGNFSLAVLILASVVIPIAQQLSNDDSYKLSADALKLVGQTDQTLAKQLTYDGQTSTYQFNKDAIKDDSANPVSAMQAQVGTADGKDKNKSLYALDVPTDFSKGVTYHDINSQLSFSLVPQFKASAGKEVNNHLVYPLSGGNQAVYTLKNNGLKEDIVVPRTMSDTMTFSYMLHLPKTLEAKVIPNDNGAIGIYSGDPSLFGDISYGSDTDRANVEKAREKAAKNYLVFGLPSPVIKGTTGKEVASARFQLDGSKLSVIATGLANLQTPVTIDPSVVVTSTSNFQAGGNVEDNIDFSTSGQVTRGGLTGGSINGGWNTTTSLSSSGRWSQGGAVYNGYIYQIGGSSGGASVEYAHINTDGTVGSWTYTAAYLPKQIGYPDVAAYNGYLYIIGGYDVTSAVALSTVMYTALSPTDGSFGTLITSSNSLATATCRAGIAVYNGYIYITGGASSAASACGNSSTGLLNSVQYAPLTANGDVGSWTTSANTFTNARMSHVTFANNGYLYVMGGTQDGTGPNTYKDTQYAPINADGTIGSWITSSVQLPTAIYRPGATVYDGYVYMVGNGNTNSTAVVYAPINATGNIGAWQATTSLSTGNYGSSVLPYNGYIYELGGVGTLNTVLYAKIDPAGVGGAWHYTHNSTDDGTTFSAGFTTTRYGQCSVAVNGYMYVIGGFNGGSPIITSYYAPINANGTVGTWTVTSSLINAQGKYAGGCTTYNGYIYTIAGLGSSSGVFDQVEYSAIATNGTLGAWHFTHNSTDDGTTYVSGILGGARYGNAAVAFNGYLYSLGGSNGAGTSSYNDVQYAPLNSNGTVGTWHFTHASTDDGTTFSAGFSGARALFGAVVSGGNVYMMGGHGGVYYNDIQYAPLNSNGTVGTWTTNSTSFTNARQALAAFVSNGVLYIAGGKDGSGTTYGDVQYAPINTDGSVGTWNTTTTYTTARTGAAAFAYNGNMYILGGQNGATYYQDVQYAPINNGGSGTSGIWASTTSVASQFPNCVEDNEIFVSSGYLYTVGGADSSAGCSTVTVDTAFSSVYYAPINADGSVGTWVSTSSMNTARFNFGLAVYNGYVYAMGGFTVGGSPMASTEYASISPSGGLGTWTTSTTMGTAISENRAVAYNGYMYSLGGLTTSSFTGGVATVQYAPINTGGSLGSWSTTTSFPTARSWAGATAANGYLYVAGGTNTSNGSLGDVEYAPLNSDGTISAGAWRATSSMETPLKQPRLVAQNGYMLVLGGVNGGLSLNSGVESASIAPNGTLGGFGRSSTNYANARNIIAMTVYNGYAYLVGGQGASAAYNDVQYAPLNMQPRIGHYSKLIDLGTAVNVTGITYNGVVPTGASAITYKAAGSNGVFGLSGLANAVSGSTGCLGNLTGTRYVWLSVTLDDSSGGGKGGFFPDINGAAALNANLTDFTVNYNPVHPPPNIRLRAGQTLQAGNLSALDTCYP